MASIHETLAPHHDGPLRTRNGEVHLLRGGTGEPVLYLHGIGEAGGWNAVHEALSRRFDLIAPDHPGFGYAVETSAEVIADLFRYGGGRVLALSGPLQRYPRDALAARQHIGVSEENFERAGRSRIERAERLLLLSAPGRGSLKMVDR